MDFVRISRENKKWDALWRQWDEECSKYDESLSDYAPSSISIMKPLAEDPQVSSAGIYALYDGGEILAACQINVAGLPGYTGKVIRLRHLVLSPKFDFDESTSIDEYVKVLTGVFSGTIQLATKEMPAEHAKLHFLSPADKEFFKEIEASLRSSAVFKSVALKGSWLYVSI